MSKVFLRSINTSIVHLLWSKAEVISSVNSNRASDVDYVRSKPIPTASQSVMFFNECIQSGILFLKIVVKAKSVCSC